MFIDAEYISLLQDLVKYWVGVDKDFEDVTSEEWDEIDLDPNDIMCCVVIYGELKDAKSVGIDIKGLLYKPRRWIADAVPEFIQFRGDSLKSEQVDFLQRFAKAEKSISDR